MVVVFVFAGGSSQTWIAQEDCIATSFSVLGGAAVRSILSNDPGLLVSDYSAASSNSLIRNSPILAFAAGGATSEQISVPVSAGEGLSVAISAAGSAMLQLQLLSETR